MEGAGELAALAIPFAAGAAAGLLILPPAGGLPAWILPAVILPVLPCLAAAACRLPRPLPAYMALYFCLGLFCQCSSHLLPVHAGPPDLALHACESLKRLISAIPYPHERTAGLVQALMTGDRSALDRDTVAAFQNSGAAHILALSGLHLGLLYLLIRKTFSLMGNTPAARLIRSLLTTAATGFYTLMTGAGPSIVRAFLYICISEWSSLAPGRKKDPTRILLIALTVQLGLRPAVIGSLGFQLSYLAMLGITILLPRLQAWYPAPQTRLERADPMRRIWNAAALTLSCQVFTAPLVWLRFHTFPKYFLLTNLLSLPLSSSVISVSALTIVLSATDCCPTLLVRLNDTLVQALLHILEIISEM